jgi:micrococcal nuclease
VYLEDGTMLNGHLLKMGYAVLLTVPPNVKYAENFYALQTRVRNKKKACGRISKK